MCVCVCVCVCVNRGLSRKIVKGGEAKVQCRRLWGGEVQNILHSRGVWGHAPRGKV